MKTNTLTKEQKEAWLIALKSKKYKQGDVKLYNNDNNTYCCLGIFCLVHPDLSISDDGRGVILNGKNERYLPFEEILSREVVNKLWRENDNSVFYNNKSDYSEVIPLIEQLETID